MFEPIIGAVLAHKQLVIIGLAITGLAFYTGLPGNMSAAATTIFGIDIPDVDIGLPDLDLGPYANIAQPILDRVGERLEDIDSRIDERLQSIEDLLNDRLGNI
jgi:hypothetical protein